MGVIPYIPAHDKVHNAAHNELKGGDNAHTVEAFEENAVTGVTGVPQIHYQQTRPAREGHRPVSVAS